MGEKILQVWIPSIELELNLQHNCHRLDSTHLPDMNTEHTPPSLHLHHLE